ncbi:MAG: tryptophan--tRNA ligase [Thermoproteota archaeon]|jgi:tryptophanyl-tRNA synthetase
MEEFRVTPWEVEGKVDYLKLVKDFGLKLIDDNLIHRIQRITGELNVMLRRKFFFAHRDMDLVLNDYENGKGFFLYTGRGPSGPMHIGHLIPFYFTKWLQEKFNVNVYIEITDDEKFLEKDYLSYEEVQKWAYENVLDIIAVGFDPDKTFIFYDSEYIKNVYPLLIKIAKKINYSLVKAVFGFKESTNIGMIFFPCLQIIPTFFEKRRCLIPAAIDQDPYWRIQRDLAESLGYYKAAMISSKFFPPLTGIEGKMSSSKPETAIWLTDEEEKIRKKIFKYAFSGGQPTVELHRKYGGNPEIDVSFQWLYNFFEENDEKIKKIEEDYKSGALLSGELKQILIEKLVDFINKHKEKRERAKELVHVYKYEGKLAKEMWNKIYL